VINAGIAGAFPGRGLSIGDVVNVGTERFGDLGAEQADGSFADVHEMELIAANQFPFQNGRLVNPGAENQGFLPLAHGLTINKVHGHAKSIESIRTKYDADIETMEGAAFFFACLQEQQSFLEIRAISNHVESRNKDNWDIPQSINNLNTTLLQMVESFL
ncbi:MAG: futalosine hydrolase, partial [Bacteroidota bacterium]